MFFFSRSGLLILSVFFVFLSCKSEMIREEKLSVLNDRLSGSTYVAKENISADYVPAEENNLDNIIKKGQEVRLQAESNPLEWLRLRAFNPKDSLETAVGITVIYIFKADYPEVTDYEALLMEKMNEKFEKKN